MPKSDGVTTTLEQPLSSFCSTALAQIDDCRIQLWEALCFQEAGKYALKPPQTNVFPEGICFQMRKFYGSNHKTSELVNCLERVPPVELQAVSLLQAIHGAAADGTLPAVSQETLTSATSELIAYTRACVALVSKLQYLTPIVLSSVECVTWPL